MRISHQIVLTLLVALAADAAETTYWSLRQTPTAHTLYRLSFLDSLRGWAVGDSGTILRTTDGGISWSEQQSGISARLWDIQMIDPLHGWALAIQPLVQPGQWYGSYLLATTDGGEAWTVTEFPEEFFYTVEFVDSLRGWMGGEYGTLLGSTDGGATWEPASVDSSDISGLPIRSIKFVTPQLGFGVGGYMEYAGVIWRTTDGGGRWVTSRTGEVMLDLHPFDSLRLIAVGGGYDDGVGVAQTTDGGLQWQFAYVGPYGQAWAVDFRTKAEGWASLGFAGTVMSTFDAGLSWSAEYTPGSTPVYDVVFTDLRHGYMVGGSGRFFVYNAPLVVPVGGGWNMLSLPVQSANAAKESVFPTAVSGAFSYGPSGYELNDTIRIGTGYWLRYDAAGELSFRGDEVLHDTITIRTGWNFIGSISVPVETASIVTAPEGVLVSPFYGYAGGYVAADTVRPGRGYWVKSAADGVIVLGTPPPAAGAR